MRTIFRGLLLLVVLLFVGCGHKKAPTGGPEDTEKPTILNVYPNEFEDISGKEIEIDFSKLMDLSSFYTGLRIYPELTSRKMKLDGSKLIITFDEELKPDTNYFFSFTEKIFGIHRNPLEKQYDLTFTSGKLNENRISGIFTYEKPEDKLKDIKLSLFSADTTLIKTITVKERYDFETLNNETHSLRAYIDLNKNKKLETDREPFANAIVPASLYSNIDLYLAYQDSTPPIAKRVMTRFSDEIDIVFDEEIKDIKNITISTADSLKIPQQIKRWRILEKEVKVFTSNLDTLNYNVYIREAEDLKSNFSEIDSLEFKGITKLDTVPPKVISVNPRNGSSVLSLKPEITITFSEVIFRENVEAWLVEAETGDQFKLKDMKGDNEIHKLKVMDSLNNFNTYNIQLNVYDPRGNALKDFEGSIFLPIVRE